MSAPYSLMRLAVLSLIELARLGPACKDPAPIRQTKKMGNSLRMAKVFAKFVQKPLGLSTEAVVGSGLDN